MNLQNSVQEGVRSLFDAGNTFTNSKNKTLRNGLQAFNFLSSGKLNEAKANLANQRFDRTKQFNEMHPLTEVSLNDPNSALSLITLDPDKFDGITKGFGNLQNFQIKNQAVAAAENNPTFSNQLLQIAGGGPIKLFESGQNGTINISTGETVGPNLLDSKIGLNNAKIKSEHELGAERRSSAGLNIANTNNINSLTPFQQKVLATEAGANEQKGLVDAAKAEEILFMLDPKKELLNAQTQGELAKAGMSNASADNSRNLTASQINLNDSKALKETAGAKKASAEARSVLLKSRPEIVKIYGEAIKAFGSGNSAQGKGLSGDGKIRFIETIAKQLMKGDLFGDTPGMGPEEATAIAAQVLEGIEPQISNNPNTNKQANILFETVNNELQKLSGVAPQPKTTPVRTRPETGDEMRNRLGGQMSQALEEAKQSSDQLANEVDETTKFIQGAKERVGQVDTARDPRIFEENGKEFIAINKENSTGYNLSEIRENLTGFDINFLKKNKDLISRKFKGAENIILSMIEEIIKQKNVS